jgi:hypothetical protein
MSHDSKSAERLALGWHGIAPLVAGTLALNALIFGSLLSFAHESERTFYVMLPWTVRLYFIAAINRRVLGSALAYLGCKAA